MIHTKYMPPLVFPMYNNCNLDSSLNPDNINVKSMCKYLNFIKQILQTEINTNCLANVEKCSKFVL